MEHILLEVGRSAPPPGRYVLAGGRDGTARVWDLAGEEPPHSVLWHDQQVTSLAFTDDGRRLLTQNRSPEWAG